MDKKFISLAKRCAMGDIEAMYGLAEWFRYGFTRELKGLADAYEKTPDSSHLEELKEYLYGKPDEVKISLKAYMMWMVRAALYGHKEAGSIVERCAYYRDEAYLPLKVFLPGKNECIKYLSSKTLYNLGFLDFDFNKTGCRLISLNEWGYYIFLYVSYYDPADDDGFGMEMEYDEIYFDEFFNRIPVEKESGIESELAKLRQAREKYWNDPDNYSKTRKYTRNYEKSIT